MLSIAKELNLSETAFVRPLGKGATYSIRFFSPKMEIALCGHATLASAKVIFETTDADEIHFITHQKLDLAIRKSGSELIMQFPCYELEPATAPEALLKSLGMKEILHCAKNRETNILLLEIESSDELRGLSPDFQALLKSHSSINGVLVTARSVQDEFDFHSRYFWPWSGTHEDPVTGGTHTFLAPYWSNKLNKKTLRSFQSSERTGMMEIEIIDRSRLDIKGSAVIVLEGSLRLNADQTKGNYD